MSNKEHLEWLEKYIKNLRKQDLKKKLKENHYDKRLDKNDK